MVVLIRSCFVEGVLWVSNLRKEKSHEEEAKRLLLGINLCYYVL